MKKTMLAISFTSIIAFAPVTTLAQETVELDVGNRIAQPLERSPINDQLHAETHQAQDNRHRAPANWLDRKGNQINDRLHTKTHRVRDNKRHALVKRLYRKGGQISNRIHAGQNNQRRDWIRSRNNQSEQRFSSFRNTQRFHRSQGRAQSARRLARR